MTYIAKPQFQHPKSPENALGLTERDYEGAVSTLCAGCGHDSISGALVKACYELELEPHRVAKLSGIGCSSKTPTYFLGKSHGFNSVHGRMPSVLTGAQLANRDLMYIGVSGDGDTASIGMGQFTHLIRRNVNTLYLVENNGVYGLTKGQFSATANKGAKSKKGVENDFSSIDLASMAIQLGATFVARSFSGDRKQLVALLKAAMAYPGAAFIDCISPCVTFNNHVTSSLSYDFVRDHNESVGRPDLIPIKSEIKADYEQGTREAIELHDGSVIYLAKNAKDYDPYDRGNALSYIQKHQEAGNIVTGLLYIDREPSHLCEDIGLTDTPLNELTEKELCPGGSALNDINESLR